MVVELRMQFCKEIFMIHLRSIGSFNDVYMFCKSANSIIVHSVEMILRIVYLNYSITTMKMQQKSKLIEC